VDLFVIKRDGFRISFNIKWVQATLFTAAKSGQQKSVNYAAKMTNKVKLKRSPTTILIAHNIAV
jgi:hypothetical protein